MELPQFVREFFNLKWSIMNPQKKRAVSDSCKEFLAAKLDELELAKCYNDKRKTPFISIPRALADSCGAWLKEKMDLGTFDLKASPKKSPSRETKINTGLRRRNSSNVTSPPTSPVSPRKRSRSGNNKEESSSLKKTARSTQIIKAVSQERTRYTE